MATTDLNAIKIKQILQPGMVITHRRCMEVLEEHVYRGWDGIWIVGTATADQVALSGLDLSEDSDADYANDIHPCNITHINRIPIALWLEDSPEADSFDPKARAFRY